MSRIHRLATNLSGLGLIVMTAMVMMDVIMRRIFNAPLIFADEVAGYLLVMVTLLGLGYTLKEDGHIQVMVLVQKISERKRFSLRIMWCSVSIVYAVIILIFTAELTWESYDLNAFSSNPSQLLLFPFQIVMPIGCLLFLIQLVIELMTSVLSLFSSKPSTISGKE